MSKNINQPQSKSKPSATGSGVPSKGAFPFENSKLGKATGQFAAAWAVCQSEAYKKKALDGLKSIVGSSLVESQDTAKAKPPDKSGKTKKVTSKKVLKKGTNLGQPTGYAGGDLKSLVIAWKQTTAYQTSRAAFEKAKAAHKAANTQDSKEAFLQAERLCNLSFEFFRSIGGKNDFNPADIEEQLPEESQEEVGKAD